MNRPRRWMTGRRRHPAARSQGIRAIGGGQGTAGSSNATRPKVEMTRTFVSAYSYSSRRRYRSTRNAGARNKSLTCTYAGS